MKSALLFLIVFFCSVSTANAAYHNATTIIRKGEIPGSFLVTTTLNDIGPIPDSNICNGTITSTAYPCGYTFAIYPIATNGSVATARLITDLVDRRPPNQCSTSTCKTNIATAKTIGELVPLMKYRGGFGIAKTELIRPYFELEGFRSCLYFSNSSAVGNGSSGRFDCSPLIPLTTSCDILDTDALVNFGTFGNDVVSRQASGSFKIDCSGDSSVRVKFASNVTNMSLSQDGKLTASLKVRNSTPGANSLESFVNVRAGTQEIFIDGDLKNNNTSHTGPFSASVVLIVEVA